MNCLNCQQPLEAGAAFCGNCGQAVAANTVAASTASAPAKAVQRRGEKRALLAVLFGVAGIAGGLFIPLLGLVLGVAGLVMGTLSHSGSRRGLSTAGLFLSGLALLVSLATWTYAVQHDPGLNQSSLRNGAGAESRTPITSLENWDNSRYTTPASFTNRGDYNTARLSS